MLTKNGAVLAVKKLNWSEAASKIAVVNPALATIMKVLDVNKANYMFYLASYPFGNEIINDKKLYLPLEGGDAIAFDDPLLPDLLRKDLKYDRDMEDPMGIILSKTSEFYLSGDARIQPHSIITPGQVFGIPRAIDNSPSTSSVLEINLNAGCRSVFMLPKISDQVNHSKLQEIYGVTAAVPNTPQEHWNVFVDIAKQANSDWRTEVLYFPRNWINNITSSEWATIELELVRIHRKSYSIWHKVADIWSKAFHEIEEEKQLNKHYSMQSLETVKHLFKMAADVIPGFRPATNDESAPISLLTKAYTTAYNMLARPKYTAIIMEPTRFSMKSDVALYHSINHASFTTKPVGASKKKSQIALLEEIRVITELYAKGIVESRNDVKSLYDVTMSTKFSYYHTNPENYSKIKNAALLNVEEKEFINDEYSEFPNNAAFFKGCIKISRS